jgi:hypothetical protein
MRFELTEAGVTAAQTAAGHEGYVIPKNKMLNIIAAAMPHVTSIDEGEEITIPQAHTAHFEEEVGKHINLLWMGIANHERLLVKASLKERVRWLLRGHL